MELTFYDAAGRAVAYCEDERHIYSFTGVALAYVEDDSVYGYDGRHLGWWDGGWIRDHDGVLVFFTELADDRGPRLPIRQPRPAKGVKDAPPPPVYKHVKPARFADGSSWLRSGAQFFPTAV
jgi:hypothetical protein